MGAHAILQGSFVHHVLVAQQGLVDHGRFSLSGACSHESRVSMAWRRTVLGGCSSNRGGREGLRWRRFMLRSAASESDSPVLKTSIEQVQKMQASAIKDELTKLGVSYADCFEKQELVVRLAIARLNNVKNSRSNLDSNKTYKPLTQISITRLRNTTNSPKNYILIPLKINNQGPFNFILDTGSTVTLVQPSIVIDKLQLSPRSAQQSLALLGGGISDKKVMSVTFSDVELGNHPMNNISALLMDQTMLQGWDPSIAGLLGLNILSQFDVEFDFNSETLIFHPPGAANRRECDVQGMEKLQTSDITLGILGVKVALGRAIPEMALLDLGSSLCVVSPDVARLAGVPENIIPLTGSAELLYVLSTAYSSHLWLTGTGSQSSKNPGLGGGGIGQLTAMQFSNGFIDISMISAKNNRANFTIKGAQFAIGEIPALRAVGCRILLGVNLFNNIRMIFSQSTKSVYVERPRM